MVAPYMQADGTIKNRPGVALRILPRYRDLLACGISTQLHQEVAGLDEHIGPDADDFVDNGLVTESVIRVSYLAVLPQSSILGSTGFVSAERHRRLLESLANYLLK